MKNAILIFVALIALTVMLAVNSNAQITTTLMNNKAYAASQIDTSGAFDISGDIRDFLVVTTKDSAAVTIYTQTKPPGSSTWTTVMTDSLATSTNTGKIQEYVIRDFTVEQSPTAGLTRLIMSWSAYRQGVTSAKYYAVIWRPR